MGQKQHPLYMLLLLLVWTVAGAFVMTILSFLLLWAFKGSVVFESLMVGSDLMQADVNTMKWVQLGSSIGIFVLPPLLLGISLSPKQRFYTLQGGWKPILFLLTAAILFAATPLMHGLIELNKQMTFPESWAALEQWMMQKEGEMERLTKWFLQDTSYPALFLNLLVMAVAPAIGEELFFRGALQKIMISWWKNPHVAIWFVAIFFSAIHLQFYGFLPRVLLGLLFGYLYYWGKNIWLPIFAHFINNAMVVVTAFVMQRRGLSIDDAGLEEQIPLPLYAVCAVIAGLLLYQYWKHSRTANLQKHGEKLG